MTPLPTIDRADRPRAGGLFDWFTGSMPPERADVRAALLLTVPESALMQALSFFWSQAVALFAVWVTGAAWAVGWSAFDIGLLLLRVHLHRVHATAVRNGTPLPTAAMLGTNVALVAAVAAGGMGCLWHGDLRLTVLAIILIVGFLGYFVSRCAAFPRVAAPLVYLLAYALAFGLLRSPWEQLRGLGVLAQFCGIGFHTLLALNHKTLASAVRSQQENKRLARSDPLTGLANRLALQDRLSALDRQPPDLDRPGGCALLCFDLDGFKSVNDRHGHASGDRVLTATAQRLLSAVRTHDLVCRTGGDEFVIVLPGADRALAEAVARRAIAACEQPIDVGAGKWVQVGTSVGIATTTRTPIDSERLLSRADAALYTVKGRGKGHWVISDGDANFEGGGRP